MSVYNVVDIRFFDHPTLYVLQHPSINASRGISNIRQNFTPVKLI